MTRAQGCILDLEIGACKLWILGVLATSIYWIISWNLTMEPWAVPFRCIVFTVKLANTMR